MTFFSSNASEAKQFCEEVECPSNWKYATAENCCIYHANIHSCPLEFMVSNARYFCVINIYIAVLGARSHDLKQRVSNTVRLDPPIPSEGT